MESRGPVAQRLEQQTHNRVQSQHAVYFSAVYVVCRCRKLLRVACGKCTKSVYSRALYIYRCPSRVPPPRRLVLRFRLAGRFFGVFFFFGITRSEEHTSELQSPMYL